MFRNEKLLKQTPRFTVLLICVCLCLHLAIYLRYASPYQLTLEPHVMAAHPRHHLYRLFTSPFMCGSGTWKTILLHTVGLHVGSWFVIAATKGRWQKMLTTYLWNYLVVCLVAYFLDPVTFAAPQLTLLVAQVGSTYMLEDTQTYVPQIVSSIFAFWYVFMQLAYPIPVFAGVVIGLAQGLLATSTPALIGFDLFYPPEWLTYLCERFLNRTSAAQVDQRRRRDDSVQAEEEEAQMRRDAEPVDAATERQRRLDAIARRTASRQRIDGQEAAGADQAGEEEESKKPLPFQR